MLSTSHVVFNALTAIYLINTNPLPLNSYWFVGGTLLGSLLPDMDKKGSKIAKMGFFLRLDHRGLTHSLLGFFSFACLALLFTKLSFALGIILGYGGHILQDMMTTQGVSLFYPQKRKIRFPFHLKTGGLMEKLLLLLALVYMATYLKHKA